MITDEMVEAAVSAQYDASMQLEEDMHWHVYRGNKKVATFTHRHDAEEECLRIGQRLALEAAEFAAGQPTGASRKFQLGTRVYKTKGASRTGRVCGFYSTALTPIGYAVESENEPGSVQIYPESALSKAGA